MNPQIAQKLAAAVDRMPAFPKSVQRILELARNSASTPKYLVAVIESLGDLGPLLDESRMFSAA